MLSGRASIGRLWPPALALSLLTIPCASCSKQSAPKTCFPVEGRVLFKGKPVSGVLVVFKPADPSDPKWLSASGTTDDDGWFSLSTYVSDDGAPPGDYDVTVTQTTADTFKHREPFKKAPSKDAPKSPKTAKFKAHVDAMPNQLPPFELPG